MKSTPFNLDVWSISPHCYEHVRLNLLWGFCTSFWNPTCMETSNAISIYLSHSRSISVDDTSQSISIIIDLSHSVSVDDLDQKLRRVSGAAVHHLERPGNRCLMCQAKLDRSRHHLFGLIDALIAVLYHPLLKLPPLLAIGFLQLVQPFRIFSVSNHGSVFIIVTSNMHSLNCWSDKAELSRSSITICYCPAEPKKHCYWTTRPNTMHSTYSPV